MTRAAAVKIRGPAGAAGAAHTIQPRRKGRGYAALTIKIKYRAFVKRIKKRPVAGPSLSAAAEAIKILVDTLQRV